MKHTPRLYIESISDTFELSESHYAHLIRVLRINEGEHFKAFNKIDGEWLCEISSVSKKSAACKKVSLLRKFEESKRQAIAFCLIKHDNMRLIVEKCTELGITDFYLLVSQFTNSKASIDKLYNVAISASEQSERIDIPTIHPIQNLIDFVRNLPSEFNWFSAIERSDQKFNNSECSKGFIIGPEGGFSDHEKELLSKYTTPCSISNNVLRSETAAITAAVIQHAANYM